MSLDGPTGDRESPMTVTSQGASGDRALPVPRIHGFLIASGVAILIWSGLFPRERFTWLMEVLPAIAGGAVLVATYRRLRFTTVTYLFAWVFAIVLMVGGHWTYAEVPIGNWIRDAMGFDRNHYDRFGHVLQGVIPALFARELLLRTRRLARGRWLLFICVCIAVAISAGYEMFEWQYAALFGGDRADDFLGSQGDIWDAQKDMLMATLGAIGSLLLIGPVQDRQMALLNIEQEPAGA
jgi:putative membrane protein